MLAMFFQFTAVFLCCHLLHFYFAIHNRGFRKRNTVNVSSFSVNAVSVVLDIAVNNQQTLGQFVGSLKGACCLSAGQKGLFF